jgi:hypothetical protein
MLARVEIRVVVIFGGWVNFRMTPNLVKIDNENTTIKKAYGKLSLFVSLWAINRSTRIRLSLA